MLGIVHKHHTLLEKAADRIDRDIMVNIEKEHTSSNTIQYLKQYGNN